MTIEQIAKKHKVSDSTARRKMQGKKHVVKTVSKVLPNGVKRKQNVLDYAEASVAQAFATKKAKKK